MAPAYQIFGRCVGVASQNGFGSIEVVNGPIVGFTHMHLNQISEARENEPKTVAAANKVGHQRAKILGEILAVQTSFVMADYTTARQHNIKVIEIARQLGSPRFEAQGLLYRGKLNQPKFDEEKPSRHLKRLLR